ncbi:RNA polymerase sigma factor [Ruminococcaceae bacterium OttesenSCG-928-O06]|nr:RNA polymerase sigma factor [Ruminococcaceae bacterium OttesenSCG-928-O06]
MNDAQFGQVVAQYEKLVYTICYQYTKNHHTAQDLAQETFLSAYTHRESCPADSMKPWLARIATNKAKDHLKSAYNRRVRTEGEDGLPESSGTVLFAKEDSPESLAIGKETLEKIKGDIYSLKEPYHKVAVLYFLEEKSVEEIAASTQRPPKTVHTQLYRAKRLLQEKMKGGGEDGAVP